MMTEKWSTVFALIAVLTLTGSQCVFIARSGGDSSEKEDEDTSNLVVIIREGRLVDAPVEGVRFVSGNLSGLTGPDGEFKYLQGESVRFFIGDIALGEAAEGKPIITPLDLVPGGGIDTPAVINIARLLQSLDAVQGDDRITIPAELGRRAQHADAVLHASIQSLDYADETAFVNSASQLVATLTAAYPFTAVLVDADTARQHLKAALAE